MAAKPFHIDETPALSPESSKMLVRSIQSTQLSPARQTKLQNAARVARNAYQKPLPLLGRVK